MIYKNKYFLSIILILLIIISLSVIVNAETIVYDNITTANYKTLKISSDTMNIKYLNDYPYEVYFNDSFVGYYKKGDNIFYPDNVNIKIIPQSIIKTDTTNIYQTVIFPTLITFLGFLFSWGLAIILILIIIIKLWRDYVKR